MKLELEKNNYFDEYDIDEAAKIIDNYNTSGMIEFFENVSMQSFNYKEKSVLSNLIR